MCPSLTRVLRHSTETCMPTQAWGRAILPRAGQAALRPPAVTGLLGSEAGARIRKATGCWWAPLLAPAAPCDILLLSKRLSTVLQLVNREARCEAERGAWHSAGCCGCPRSRRAAPGTKHVLRERHWRANAAAGRRDRAVCCAAARKLAQTGRAGPPASTQQCHSSCPVWQEAS